MFRTPRKADKENIEMDRLPILFDQESKDYKNTFYPKQSAYLMYDQSKFKGHSSQI